MGLFGKEPKKDPKEQVRDWTSALRKESRQLDRQIRSIEMAEVKVKRSIKDAAKKNNPAACKILAKELVQSRKAKNRIYTSKAHLNSIGMQMKNQLALLRVSGCLEKSTVVMKAMQSLVKVPEMQATMMELSKEMMKAGIIEEMMEDTLDQLDDVDEDATQEEVDKILFEVTAGALSTAPSVNDELPGVVEGATGGPESEEEEEEEEDLQAMQARLEALRS